MAKLDPQTLRTLDEAGIGFMGGVDAPGGSRSVYLKASELQSFIDDPKLFYARSQGASLEDYETWLAVDGKNLCIAQTKKGHRCSNMVNGDRKSGYELAEWLRAPDGYCLIHGG